VSGSVSRLLFVVATAAALGSAGCGDDTTLAPSDGGPDVTQTDAPTMKDGSGGQDGPSTTEGGMDAGDGGPCDFAAFVTGLIQNDTNSTSQPSTNLGQSCTDQMNQAQFQSLFP
jgi:hypothetical protein